MSRISGRPVIGTQHLYGLALRTARWREGSAGVPLLFLNGIGADIAAAAPLLAQIHGREVWTLDMPGVGGSPDAILPYTAPTMAAIVMEIAERFGHSQLDLAGFSWGGALAQQIAVQFPARIRRMVLMATTPSVGAPGIGWAALLDDDMLASGLKLPTATPLGLTYQAMAMAGWTAIRHSQPAIRKTLASTAASAAPWPTICTAAAGSTSCMAAIPRTRAIGSLTAAANCLSAPMADWPVTNGKSTRSHRIGCGTTVVPTATM